MPDIRVITWGEHHTKRWSGPQNYKFAAKDNIAAIGLHEVSKVMMELPIAFVRNENIVSPVVVMGYLKGQNLVISPRGAWLPSYIPALYRLYPFRLAKTSKDELVVCIDIESGLIKEESSGNLFFDNDKNPTAEVREITNALLQMENERETILKISQCIIEGDLLLPWPLRVQVGDKVETYEGLYRLDEAKLNTLPDDDFIALRNCGGLMLSYGQLFSMQHLHSLGNFSQRTARANFQQAARDTVVPLNIVDDDGNLSFANL